MFTRAPIPGAAKRRLIPALGPEGAAELQRRMTRRIVAEAVAADVGDVSLWCTPDCSHPSFAELAVHYPTIRLRDQEGCGLGERMCNAFREILRSRSFALLAGSDCPALGANRLRLAVEWLARRAADAVIAPALDGGYVLVGLRRVDASLFDDMPWGTDRVLTETRRRMSVLGWKCREFEPLPDIDRPADLVHLESAIYSDLIFKNS